MSLLRNIATLAVAASLLLTPFSATARAKINDVYVIHFVVDGTNLKAFEKALDEGRMPNVKRHFVDGGARFEKGLSAFPSTSTSVYQSYATGLWPGHAGIPHLERMDRETERVVGYMTPGGYDMIDSDLINLRALTNPDVVRLTPPTTIFELLEGWPSASIYSSFSRGATVRYPKIAPVAALWSGYVSEIKSDVDSLAMRRVMQLFGGEFEEIPRYTLVGLYSSDMMGHAFGPMSDDVQEVLVQFDVFMRDFLELLEKRGIAEKTYVIVTADHGMHDTGKLFKFRKAMVEHGWRLKSSPAPRADFSIYTANRGVVSSHLYIRHDGGFEPIEDAEVARSVPLSSGKPDDLISFIRSLDAIDLIAVRAGERRARVIARDGSWAEVECYTVNLIDHCAYVTAGGDPLGYMKSPGLKALVDGKPHSTLAWREAAADEEYPDAVVGLSQIFNDGRAGDIFVTTHDGYGFRSVKQGNHGGPTHDDMRVPIFIAGPSVPKGTFGAARPPDLYALALEWFGLEVPETNHDGSNPFERFKGEDASLAALAALDQRFDDTSAAHKALGKAAVGAKRAGIRKLATEEAKRRLELAGKLSDLLKEIEAKTAKGEYDKRYAEDHAKIVRRAKRWAEAGGERMKAIEKSLGGKR